VSLVGVAGNDKGLDKLFVDSLDFCLQSSQDAKDLVCRDLFRRGALFNLGEGPVMANMVRFRRLT